jgi:hypothetical protein
VLCESSARAGTRCASGLRVWQPDYAFYLEWQRGCEPPASAVGAGLQSLCDNDSVFSGREFNYAARLEKVVIPNEVRDLRFVRNASITFTSRFSR